MEIFTAIQLQYCCYGCSTTLEMNIFIEGLRNFLEHLEDFHSMYLTPDLHDMCSVYSNLNANRKRFKCVSKSEYT